MVALLPASNLEMLAKFHASLRMLHVPHTGRHLKFLIVGRNLKQAGGLRAFFDVLQLSASLSVLPLYWKMKFGIDPEISALAIF